MALFESTRQMGRIAGWMAAVSLMLLVFAVSHAQSDRAIKRNKRLALVIGNGSYQVAPLKNPVNDARDMAATLKRLGFEVDDRINAGKRSMKQAIRRFTKKLRQGGLGLFYFAGHGVQVDGRNYLIPVNATIESEADAEFESVDAGWVMAKMEDAGNGVSIMILDACRNNPFSRGFRNRTRGLAPMTAPTGSLIIYATAENAVAEDGDGENGLFTGYLLKYLDQPGLEIRDTVMKVRNALIRETNGKQVPFEYSSLTQKIYLAASSGYVREERPSPEPVRPEAVPVKPRYGELIVRANVPGATVWFDNTRMGKAPLKIKPVSPGNHQVKVEKSGYEPYQKQVAIEPGGSSEMTALLEEIDTGPNPGDILEGPLGMEFAWVPAGSFMMGQTEAEKKWLLEDAGEEIYNKYFKRELPRHRVTLSKGFWMGTTEVTVGQWKAFVQASGYRSEAEKGDGAWVIADGKIQKKSDANWKHPYFSQTDDHPVTCVSWNDAQALIQWLNQNKNGEYRLPTEAEWEYACRAGTTTPFFFGNCLSTNQANYDGNYPYEGCAKGTYREKTIPVGSLNQPNAWGLHDMHGNVWEWCQDWYGEYPSREVTDPTGPPSGSSRVLRGGGWNHVARFCRSASRIDLSPGFRSFDLGFRLLRTP